MPNCGPNGCSDDEEEIVNFPSIEDVLAGQISPPENIKYRPFTKEEVEALDKEPNVYSK